MFETFLKRYLLLQYESVLLTDDISFSKLYCAAYNQELILVSLF